MIILRAVKNIYCRRIVPNQRPFFIRTVSTSKKNSDATAVHTQTPHVVQEDSHEEKKRYDWQSFGFDEINEAKDRMWMWSTNIAMVFTMCTLFVGGLYYPDAIEHDWTQREAFIELRRREVLGLPLVDPNYADPATVILPPDEEFDDDDIII